jgi:stage IV sporulation protein FB
MERKRARINPLIGLLTVVMLCTDHSGIVLATVLAAGVHELGHLLAAKALQIPLAGMRWGFLGLWLEVKGRILSYGEEWLLCAAGPLVSLLTAAAGALFWESVAFARLFSCASLILGLLNLLPIRSFDGGRMLACFLAAFCTERLTEDVLRVISVLFLCVLWATAVYFLLKSGSGLSLFCFSMSLFYRFFEGMDTL